MSNKLAFVNAVGYGRFAQGGRGGKVYHITTLEDAQPAPPGSLRECVVASGPRIAVFDVAGTIELVAQLRIDNPYLTIAGQTAPGGGICLKNGSTNMDAAISPRAPHCIFACIRVRPGPGGTSLAEGARHGDAVDCFGNKPKDRDVHNLYYYHCSGSWAVDEICELYGVHEATVDGCLWAEPLNLSTHSYTAADPNIGHAKHMLAANERSANISVIRTTMTRAIDRYPEVGLSGGYFDLINCILDHWGTEIPARGGRKWVTLLKDHYGNFSANLIGNFYRPGANSDDRERLYYSHPAGALGDRLTVHLAGNLDSILGEITTVYHADPSSSALTYADQPVGDVQWGPVLAAETALTWATGALGAGASYRLNDRGERVNNRDAVDARVLYDLLQGQGSIINDPAEVGGWPQLEPGTPLDWNEHDVPRAFAEMNPGADIEQFLWS